jgi:phenylalanyl-tRNA synthetase beta chain
LGGRPSAVGPDTTTIVVEAASFDFLSIRRAQTALGLVTDASSRFSRGIDPELTETALRRFHALLREIRREIRLTDYAEVRTRPREHREISLDIAELDRTIGAPHSPDDVASVFTRLGLRFTRDGDVFTVSVGDERADLRIPEDLMEEVVRIHGLESVPATMPDEAIPPPIRDHVREGHQAIRRSLLAAGFSEVVSYTLTSPEAHRALGHRDEEPMLPLLNPMSAELTVVRRSLLPGLLAVLEDNHRQVPSAHLFEHGVVVFPEEEGISPGLPGERQRVAIVLTGAAEPAGMWSDEPRPSDFYDLADAIDGLGHDLHIEGLRLIPAEAGPFDADVCAAVVHDDTVIGHAGLLDEDVAARFGLTGSRVFAAELDADELVRLRRTDYPVRTPSRFPSVILDLSVAVRQEIPAGDVVEAAKAAGGEELTDVFVFDVFTGKGVPEGHRALGLRLTINAGSRTLTTSEAEAIRERVCGPLVTDFGAQRR